MHVDVFLRLTPIAPAGAQPFRCFDGGEGSRPRARPVCRFSAAAPRRNRGTSDRRRWRASAAGCRPRTSPPRARAARLASFADDVSFVAHHRMRRGHDAGVADGDADAPRAEVDGQDGHGADCTVERLAVESASVRRDRSTANRQLPTSTDYNARRAHEELQSRRHPRGDAEGLRPRVGPQLLRRASAAGGSGRPAGAR